MSCSSSAWTHQRIKQRRYCLAAMAVRRCECKRKCESAFRPWSQDLSSHFNVPLRKPCYFPTSTAGKKLGLRRKATPPALARKNETKETAISALGTQNDPVNTLLWPILLSLATWLSKLCIVLQSLGHRSWLRHTKMMSFSPKNFDTHLMIYSSRCIDMKWYHEHMTLFPQQISTTHINVTRCPKPCATTQVIINCSNYTI